MGEPPKETAMSDETPVTLDARTRFLEGMSYVAATVNVVTTDGPGGRAGMTVSAMSSVSADTARPTLLVCVNKSSSGATPLLQNGVFCVNILRDSQSDVADTFAGRFGHSGEARFGCAAWQLGPTGSPILDDALVAFDCQLMTSVLVGTHHVVFGEVLETWLGRSGAPLIYANRAYGTAFRLPEAS
jgi:flavin reductase (DIM6/NTAB) family NADH-FMN oxidoreductase RutF